MSVYFVAFIVLGAVMFEAFEEDWDFETAVYYCSITATTIGFGDFVPDVSLSEGGGVFKAFAVIMYITFSKCANR